MLFNKRRILIIIITAFAITILGFLTTWFLFLYTSAIPNEQGIKYTVTQGASIRSVLHDLHQRNIIRHPAYFNLLVRLKGNEYALKAGEYLFQQGTSPAGILNQITTGSGVINYTFTIVAGWNFKHLREVLDHDNDLQHTTAALSDTAIMAQLGHPELNPEGRFFPDTYYIIRGSSDLSVLRRAFNKMQSKLTEAWQSHTTDLPYKTLDEALTVASLVEKETAIDAERPIIAGVIVNRLKAHMPLQIDPTVIYAAGINYNGKIHKADLLNNSPYNTYKHRGLPPTPIAIPGMASILAAMQPQQHNYYYFVAKTREPDSPHQFSATLAEHNAAVAEARKTQAMHFYDKVVNTYFSKTPLPKTQAP